MENLINEAVKRVGGQSAFARLIGVKQPTIHKWIKAGVVPPRRVLLVERLLGISRYKLNPEIYRKE